MEKESEQKTMEIIGKQYLPLYDGILREIAKEYGTGLCGMLVAFNWGKIVGVRQERKRRKGQIQRAKAIGKF